MPDPVDYSATPIGGATLYLPKGYGFQDERIDLTRTGGRISGLSFIPWGDDNLKPLEFLKLFTSVGGNAEYSRVKSEQARMIQGMGLTFEGQADQVNFAKRIVSANDLAAWAYDLAIFNAFAAVQLYDAPVMTVPETEEEALNVAAKSLLNVYSVPIAAVRIGAPFRDETGQFDADYYFVTSDWRKVQETLSRGAVDAVRVDANVSEEMYRPVLIMSERASDKRIEEILSQASEKAKLNAKDLYLRRLHYDVEYHPASFLYPMADGESSLTELQTAAEIAKWYKRYLDKGGAPSAIVKMPKRTTLDPVTGLPTPEEQKQRLEMMQQFNEAYAGSVNAGTFIYMFFDPIAGTITPEFMAPPPDNNDRKWIEVAKSVSQRALTGLGAVAPEMFGIVTPAGFGGKADVLDLAYRIMDNSYCAPKRMRIEAYLNRVFAARGLQVTAKIKPLPSPYSTPTAPAV